NEREREVEAGRRVVRRGGERPAEMGNGGSRIAGLRCGETGAQVELQTHAGRATSNATVIRSPAPNGSVPCHIVEGNSTSRPGLGSIQRNGARSSPSSACGSPSL